MTTSATGRGALGWLLALLVGCGGTSSETPAPQSAREIPTGPLVLRPRPGASGAASAPPGLNGPTDRSPPPLDPE